MQSEIQSAFCSIEVGRLAKGACGPVTVNKFGKSEIHTPMIDLDSFSHLSLIVEPLIPLISKASRAPVYA